MELKRMPSLEDFIKFRLHNNYDKRVIFIRNDGDPANLAGHTDGEESIINQKCADQLYITYSVKDDLNNNDIIIPQDTPVLYYGGNLPDALKFLEKFNIQRKNMYNKPEEMKISGSKVTFAKTFPDVDWLPKTVFSREEALAGAVGFPVIAKIDNGHSGLGIKKFDTEKDLKKEAATFELRGEERSFDLYSQFIDFDREYRCLFIKDKCYVINERVPIIKENKSIRTKKVDEKVKFIYAYQNMDLIPKEFFDELYRISTELRKSIKLDIWSLDIVIDKQGKMWVLETNSATGFGSVKLCETYIEIYKDFYKRPLPDFFIEELWVKYMSQGHFVYWPEYKEEIMSTLWPMNYEAIVEKYPKIEYGE